MVENIPKMDEIEGIARFCRSFPFVYIYGYELPQKRIAKYLSLSQLKINGYLVSYEAPGTAVCDEPLQVVDAFSLGMSQQERREQVGVILSIEDCRYTNAVNLLQRAGYRNFFFMSEWNKRTIPYKMSPKSKDELEIEISLVDHCNLNCQCCDHFSPIAPPYYLELESFKKDIDRLAELTEHDIGRITLLGGEPLLHRQLLDFIRVTREAFSKALIVLFTNGILLSQWGKKGLWEAVKKYGIQVWVTVYPIQVDFEPTKQALMCYKIPCFVGAAPQSNQSACVWFLSEVGDRNYQGPKYSVKQPLDIYGAQEAYRFIGCYQFNDCITLRHGQLYTCPVIPYSRFFSERFHRNLPVCPEDSIDIYEARNFDELAEYMTHRPPFCRHCIKQCSTMLEWKQSGQSEFEWM